MDDLYMSQENGKRCCIWVQVVIDLTSIVIHAVYAMRTVDTWYNVIQWGCEYQS